MSLVVAPAWLVVAPASPALAFLLLSAASVPGVSCRFCVVSCRFYVVVFPLCIVSRRSCVVSCRVCVVIQPRLTLPSPTAGPPVMVTLGPPALRILPQGGVLRGVQGVFYALLLGLDEPADGDLELSCYLTLLEVGAKLNTTGVCPAPVPLPTAVTLSNGTITLQLQQVSFEVS